MVQANSAILAEKSRTRVAALIDEYQRKDEDLRNQAVELARLRTRVLSAGEHDAIRVVTAAGSEIRRVLLDARRDLLALTAQIDAVREVNEAQTGINREFAAGAAVIEQGEAASPALASEEAESRHGILTAYQDLCEVVTEMQASLDRLHHDAFALHASARAPRLDTSPLEVTVRQPEHPVARSIAPVEAGSWRPSRSMTWIAAIVVAGSTVTFAGVTAYRRVSAKAARPVTAAPVRPGTDSKPSAASALQVGVPPKPAPWAILIEARRLAWIQATVDGRVETGRLLKPGESRRVTAAREVSLRVGDAGAVFVSTPTLGPAALGRDGEIVTRRYAVNGQSGASQARQAASTSPSVATGAAAPKDVASPSAKDSASPPALGLADTKRDLIDGAQRWLKAYSRGDAAAMRVLATPDITVSDARRPNERLPAGVSDIRVALEKVTCQVVGDSAVLTGRMTEQAEVGDDLSPHVSWISQTWLHGTGQWRLADVRIISETNLQKH
jgi:uncharacterized protein DUF4115/uncharacterized protein DUF4440